MKKVFVMLFLMMGLVGCATTESLDHYYDEINWKDGINRNEAALIAKKWLVESKYEGDFQVLAPVSIGYDNLWRVTFLYKSLNYYEKVLDVYVDNVSGEVKTTEVRSKDTPMIAKDSWDGFNSSK